MAPNSSLAESLESSDFSTYANKFIESVRILQTDTNSNVNLVGGDRAQNPELYKETCIKRELIIEKTALLFKKIFIDEGYSTTAEAEKFRLFVIRFLQTVGLKNLNIAYQKALEGDENFVADYLDKSYNECLLKFNKPAKKATPSESLFPDIRSELKRLGYVHVTPDDFAKRGKEAWPLWQKKRPKKPDKTDAAA